MQELSSLTRLHIPGLEEITLRCFLFFLMFQYHQLMGILLAFFAMSTHWNGPPGVYLLLALESATSNDRY